MAGRRRRTPADRRRRVLGQNLLAHRGVIAQAVTRADLGPDDLVVEIGPGRGALTLPLARTGAQVIAVERDAAMAEALRTRLSGSEVADQVRVVNADARRFRLPREPYRVVANLPFGVTTEVMGALLDDPDGGPTRADLLVQAEVARKRCAQPPTSLRSAAWAPWWILELGPEVPRQAFRPVPAVDAAWITVRRRTPPVLPEALAPDFADAIRATWQARMG